MSNSKNALKMTSRRNISRFLILSLTVFLAVSCGRVEEKTADNSSPSDVVAEKKTDDFQESLNSVRTGNFDFVFAFRRSDGEILSGDDKKFLKANSPNDTNQWVLTADGKTAIAGSNYKFLPEHLDSLKKRFSVEDYSVKNDGGDGNQNSGNTK